MSDNPNNNLSAADRLYLDKWMSKVSRSFAVVVAALEEPLSQRLAAAYLICRVIDNIEDCKSAPAWKELRFKEVRQLLQQPALATWILPAWESEAWRNWPG